MAKGSSDETDDERDRKPTKGVAMKQMASGFADAEERR